MATKLKSEAYNYLDATLLKQFTNFNCWEIEGLSRKRGYSCIFVKQCK